MAPTGGEKFPKAARLRKRPQFLKLSRTGSKFQSAHFVVISKLNDGSDSRLGITVSAKVGNSVARNRIKRQAREFFRRHRAELPKHTDFLIIARSGAAALTGGLIVGELERVMLTRRRQPTS